MTSETGSTDPKARGRTLVQTTILNLLRPTAVLGLAVQRSIDLVSFGLHAATTATPEDLTVPETFIQVKAGEPLTVDEARREFRTWILAAGLRDCVEALGGTLEWARKESAMWTWPGTVSRRDDGLLELHAEVPGVRWDKDIVEGAARFDRLPLPAKVKHLESLGVARPAFTDDILSLNAARNCLAHRGGVVGAEDLRVADDPGMMIAWRRLDVQLVGPRGSRPAARGSVSEEGDVLQASVQSVARTYILGERLLMSEEDYLQMALTFTLYGQQLEQNIVAMQESRYAAQTQEAS